MRRNAIIALIALAAMLTAKQIVIAQSSRNADFDANGIVDFGDFHPLRSGVRVRINLRF